MASMIFNASSAMIKHDSVESKTSKHYVGRTNYSVFTRFKQNFCSNSCLKFVYLSCVTLISASFIIECILLHLIIVPYLSESIFKEGMCKYNDSKHEVSNKRCENKCSKERSTFPCLQLKVIFTPLYPINQKEYKNQLQFSKINHNAHEFVQSNNNSLAFNFKSPESQVVYFYDYFSTFITHKSSFVSSMFNL